MLAVCSGVPLAVLVGDTPVQRSLAVALRAGVLATDDDIDVVARRAESSLRDLELLLSWYPQEGARTSALAMEARRAVAHDAYHKRAAARTAERLRDYLELGDEEPVGDIAQFIESLGAAVIFDSMPKTVQGITLRDPSQSSWRSAIMVNTNHTWWGRQRFTMAHELCHFLYQDDRSLFVNRKDYPDGHLEEIRAEVFARHFLAPDFAVRQFWAEHGPKKPIDGYGVPLAKFMMRFGLSRQASIKTLVEAAGVPRSHLEAYTQVRISQLMRQARLQDEWERACSAQGEPSASHWALSMALDAYRDGLVSSEVVARVLGRSDDVTGVKQELEAAGYQQSVQSPDFR
ncbi:ImmA/IrrE family metallo-endopeptidase [Micromonospora sp. NPDC047644]|uniref:ImmA/IrrE family metallo-endopeptidase n=1 Tax=Micromonospora sp. NPDC047644 TaxID=3157203 RepID=UPI0034554316